MKAPAGDLPDRTGQSEMFTAEIGKVPYEIHEACTVLGKPAKKEALE